MNITVIIPSYNRAAVLERALSSVYQQTTPATEIIVIDDGSTDNTAETVKKFPQIKYLYQTNKGVSAARNLGIQHANNEWLAFLDSDDEWHTEKLEKQTHYLKQNPDALICHTDEIWIRNGVRVNPMKKHQKKGGNIFQHCLPLCAISPSASLIHKSLFDELGLFDETLPACEDYDMWLRITAKYPVLYIDEMLITKYGGHSDQLSKKHWGMDRFRITALEKILHNPDLSRENRAAAQTILLKKLNVVIKGAKKHQNQALLECYTIKQHHYLKHSA